MGAGKSKSSSSSSSTSTSSSTLGPDDPNGRRMAIAQEVLSTERSYVASLELCQTVRVARIVLAHALGSLTSRHHDHLLARSLYLSSSLLFCCHRSMPGVVRTDRGKHTYQEAHHQAGRPLQDLLQPARDHPGPEGMCAIFITIIRHHPNSFAVVLALLLVGIPRRHRGHVGRARSSDRCHLPAARTFVCRHRISLVARTL